MNAAQERERVYIIKTTMVERSFYDPVRLAQEFGVTTADEVVELYELHNGSPYGDDLFPGDASPEFYVELEERWDDE